MSRHEFSAKTKAQAFARAAGVCEGEGCGARLTIGKFRFDHRIPDQMGGDNSIDNCTVLCLACDLGRKTPHDLRDISKVKRIESKHRGIRKRSKFACSKDSPFKKKISGEVVRR
jgi:5-methylcytosine-specific restriction enzyme A